MKRILINQDNDYSLIVNLISNTSINGTYIPANSLETDTLDNIVDPPTPQQRVEHVGIEKIISTYEDIIEHFSPQENKHIVTGITDSKFTLIDNHATREQMRLQSPASTTYTRKRGVDKREVTEDVYSNLSRVGVRLVLYGEISCMILRENDNNENEYILYLDTPNPIKYIDLSDGSTIFSYVRTNEDHQIDDAQFLLINDAQFLLFEGICDDPKIISDVFIDRGVNSVFEKFKKMKMVKNLTELNKIGLGFYKINTKGFDFKNK